MYCLNARHINLILCRQINCQESLWEIQYSRFIFNHHIIYVGKWTYKITTISKQKYKYHTCNIRFHKTIDTIITLSRPCIETTDLNQSCINNKYIIGDIIQTTDLNKSFINDTWIHSRGQNLEKSNLTKRLNPNYRH